MHSAQVTVDMPGRGLAGDVQHRGAGEARLHQPRHRIGRPGPGGGEEHAQGARHPGIGIGHMRAAHLAARHDVAHGIALAERVEHRNIVH